MLVLAARYDGQEAVLTGIEAAITKEVCCECSVTNVGCGVSCGPQGYLQVGGSLGSFPLSDKVKCNAA